MPHAVKPATAIALIALGLAVCLPAGAQSMYRCGNTYQAFPCESGQGKVVGSVGAQQSSYQPVADAECAQRGAESVKIVWRREAGLTHERALAEVNEKQLSSSQKAYARKLVTDVYHRRGSAPEVRAAIEAECVMEKEREARAGVMNRDAVSSGWQQEPANSASKNTDNPNSGGAYRKGQGLATETAGKMRRCESFNRRLDEIARRQRAGVDVATMEKLKQEHRDLQRDMSESGC